MSNESKTDPKNDGGREERAGANATAQGPNRSASTATVTVGCKLPHGLWLDLTEKVKPGQTAPASRRFLVRGANAAGIVGGFGITEGVPEDFWQAWVEKHRYMDYVTKGLVFAYKQRASAVDAAKDHAADRSGFEPVVPSKDKNPENLPGKISTADHVEA